MKLIVRLGCFFLHSMMVLVVFGNAVGSELPVIDDRPALASVNGEPITGDDLRQQVQSFHGGMSANPGMVRRPDPEALLQRIVDAKLIIQESVNIGLDELPEVQSRLERGRTELLKRILAEQAVKGIDEVDPAEVEPIYRASVREVGVDSLLFESAEAAESFRAAVGDGGEFTTLAGQLIEKGQAQGSLETQYLKADELWPAVAESLVGLEGGTIVGPIQVGAGYTVIRLVGERFPDNPMVRAGIEQSLLRAKREERLLEYTEEMRKRYSKIDQEVLDSLDLDTDENALETALEDDRIVAVVKGAEPVTVRELTEALERNFFHGLEGAVGRKRVNEEIVGVLDRIILERATELEAQRLGVEQSQTYKSRRRAKEETVLFDTFIAKVINPEVRIDDAEMTSFYSEHIDDYSSPVMMRLESLAFGEQKDAQEALDKLRSGADLKWMRTHAAGQVGRDEAPDVVLLKGDILALPSVPEGIRKAVDGASAGDLRLHAEPDGPFYIVSVSEVFPAKPRAFAEVREQIAQQIFVTKRQDVLDHWTEELRKASEIEVYASEDQLLTALGLGTAESP